MADIVRRIPYQLDEFAPAASGGQYGLQDIQYDYAIGGIPFLSATRDQWPYTEQMAPIKKDQFDTFAEPGEQSLQGWWLRSQSDFADGAGVLYQDPDSTNPYVRQHNLRFNNSLGIDSWVPGELQLLRQSGQKVVSADAGPLQTIGYVDSSSVDACWFMTSTALQKVTDAATTSITIGGGTNRMMTSSGTTYWIGKSNGLWTGVDAGAATQQISGSDITLVAFVKARLVIAVGPALYTVAPSDTSLAMANLFYTHPNPNFKWTSACDGPNAVYVAGNDSTTGYIMKFTLDTSGQVPTFGAGNTTATMPNGERINTIYQYIGTFVGIATTSGFRVAEIDTNGDVNFGPLLFTIPGGCSGITGFDHWMWTGSTSAHEGSSGLYRIDLGEQVVIGTSTNPLRFAYSRDLYFPGSAGPVRSVSMFGGTDRKVYTLIGAGLILESASTLIQEGWLSTGRMRYNTEEPKLFKFFSIRTPPLVAELEVSLIPEGGGEIPYITYGPSFAPGQGDISTPQPPGPQNWIELKFTLRRSLTDVTQGAVMNGWQVKALPGSIRQRVITQTVQLLDHETDKGGQETGYDGFARDRFSDFQELARKGDVVVYQELIDDTFALVVIDDWKYTQLAPPGPDGNSLGGYLTIVMRTVAEAA